MHYRPPYVLLPVTCRRQRGSGRLRASVWQYEIKKCSWYLHILKHTFRLQCCLRRRVVHLRCCLSKRSRVVWQKRAAQKTRNAPSHYQTLWQNVPSSSKASRRGCHTNEKRRGHPLLGFPNCHLLDLHQRSPKICSNLHYFMQDAMLLQGSLLLQAWRIQ